MSPDSVYINNERQGTQTQSVAPKVQPKQMASTSTQKLPVRRHLPRAAKQAVINRSPTHVSTQPTPETLIQPPAEISSPQKSRRGSQSSPPTATTPVSPIQSSPRRPLTRSQTSPKFTATVSPQQTIVEPSSTRTTTSEPCNISTAGKEKSGGARECGKVNLQIVLQDLNGLQAFDDVSGLTAPQITELDPFFDEEDNVETGCGGQRNDEGCSHESDSEGSDYDAIETDESEQESLDEEHGESDGLEDIDLDNNTEGRQRLGYEFLDDDGSGSQLIVNKMAKVFKQGKLWSRGRDGKVHLAPRDIFTCKEDLLSVMKDYCIEQGIRLRKVRNDSKRYTQKCSNEGCSFRLHASALVDKTTWMIKSISGTHMCSVIEANKSAGSAWVATHLLGDFKSNPNMDANGIQQTIMARYGVLIPKYTCWRARKLMKEVVEGKHDEGYRVLPQYMEVFKEKNPESVCLINWTDQGPTKNPTFKRCTICVGSAIAAFKVNCRPLIGIDACFLKGP